MNMDSSTVSYIIRGTIFATLASFMAHPFYVIVLGMIGSFVTGLAWAIEKGFKEGIDDRKR